MLSTPLLFRVLNLSKTLHNRSVQLDRSLRESCNFSWNYKNYHVSSANFKSGNANQLNKQSQKKNLETVNIWVDITVEELAKILNVKTGLLISLIPKQLKDFQIIPTTKIEAVDVAVNIAKIFGKKCLVVKNPNFTEEKKEKVGIRRQPPSMPENLVKRPPVVTVMGHVDHGKTTLLDALRNTFTVNEEFGGITQHIGAFSVEVRPGERITFIDTPGHAAFMTLRARGAEVTDLVVLVIAADDGIMQQTIESIRIANKACVQIVVAVNKIDKPNARSIEDIKENLLTEGIQVEDRGGNVQLVPISALKKINLDLLTEVILLETEIMNLKGDPTGLVEGVILESKMEKRGVLATVIVKRGTLKKGKIIVAGNAHARVRLMLDENGKEYKEALPSTPVQVLGWKKLPSAGDEVFEVTSEKEAAAAIKIKEREEAVKKQEEDEKVVKEKAALHQEKYTQDRELKKSFKSVKTLKKLWYESRMKKPEVIDGTPSINLILKGDVHGTLQVLLEVVNSYQQHEECKLTVVDASVGNITPNDVELAELSNGIIFAFNVNPHENIRNVVMKEKKIDVRFHNVLYKLIDDLKSEITSRLPPKDVEEVLGKAEVLQHFAVTWEKKKVPVAGCKCIEGELHKKALFRALREDQVIYEGKLISMKHLKNEVSTIRSNTECGLMFESFNGEFKPNDIIICYKIVQVPQICSWDPGF